eukprot:CAMPEP_0170241442 /NCGR_PEP_ID=MMETSP0116_2-20130129/20487_1 /TAXON_ID=400756 /ORGANISM="Durinskia baltica, Strain CSIRO CS-38" /LENGTH=212 /DNA_ID=CAMNT_0010492277 /DNA_START=44 /DNA_END=679 /DNA_ORIENTATION=-
MLQLYKNEAITKVARQQIEIRQMELDWYTTNYDTMAMQSAMFAGFAFDQITEPVPEGTDLWMEVFYVTFTAIALGFELCVAMACTFCCIFGKGLALRGPHGARSVHIAVDNMQAQQKWIFIQFVAGIVSYMLSHVLQVWIYFRPKIAFTVSIPLVLFMTAIVYYIKYIVEALTMDDKRAITGQISAWAPYERIQDLDEAIYRPIEMRASTFA